MDYRVGSIPGFNFDTLMTPVLCTKYCTNVKSKQIWIWDRTNLLKHLRVDIFLVLFHIDNLLSSDCDLLPCLFVVRINTQQCAEVADRRLVILEVHLGLAGNYTLQVLTAGKMDRVVDWLRVRVSISGHNQSTHSLQGFLLVWWIVMTCNCQTKNLTQIILHSQKLFNVD